MDVEGEGLQDLSRVSHTRKHIYLEEDSNRGSVYYEEIFIMNNRLRNRYWEYTVLPYVR